MGCVATALEHIINYWKFPQQTQAEIPELSTPFYYLPSIPQGTPIDWTNMQMDYLDSPYNEASAQAVADLSLMVAQSVKMKFGLGSSATSSRYVPDALTTVFGYKTARICYRCDYTASKWHRLLQNEISNNRPVYYSGSNTMGNGHAWIIDGYDPTTHLYHCNWGENNIRDGWYSLDYLTEFENSTDNIPGEEYFGFATHNCCVIISPEEIDLTLALDTIKYYDLCEKTGHLYGIEIKNSRFLRPPSTDGYVQTELTLTNHTPDSVYYTFEALCAPLSESEFFDKGKSVGLFSLLVPPLSDTTHIIPLRFPLSGDLQFAYTPDTKTPYLAQTVHVSNASQPQLQYDDPTVSFPQVGTARIECRIHNADTEHYCGIYLNPWLMSRDEALYGSEGNTTSASYRMLNLPPDGDTTIVCQFHNLTVGETYQMLLRQIWTPVVKTLEFTVPDTPTEVPSLPSQHLVTDEHIYDLSGRILTKPKGGILINRNKKILCQ